MRRRLLASASILILILLAAIASFRAGASNEPRSHTRGSSTRIRDTQATTPGRGPHVATKAARRTGAPSASEVAKAAVIESRTSRRASVAAHGPEYHGAVSAGVAGFRKQTPETDSPADIEARREAAASSASGAELPPLIEIQRADGAVEIDAPGRFMQYVVVHRDRSGKRTYICTPDPKSARDGNDHTAARPAWEDR
jgi:hypothetical protein